MTYAHEERQKSHIGETPVHGSFGDPGRWDETDVFKKINTTSQRSKYEKRVQNTDEALEILGRYAPEKTSMLQALAGKADVDDSVYKDIVENRHDYNMIVQKIREKDKKIGNCKAEIANVSLRSMD